MLSPTRPPTVHYELPDTTIAGLLVGVARADPAAVAVIEGATTLRYSELYDAAVSVAVGLRARGVGPGDAVVVQLPNWWETVVAGWAVALAGAVLVPVVPIYRRRELGFVVAQVRPAAVIAAADFRGHRHADTAREVLAEAASGATVVSVRGSDDDPDAFETLLASRATDVVAVDAVADDVAVVLYTSGTSADPKGVLHSSRTLLAEVTDVASWCGLVAGDERVFMASPLSHITGLCYGILLPAALGGPVVLQDRWDPAAAVSLIEDAGCTFTVSATPFLRGLAEQYADGGRRSSLRTFVCGGADIPPELVREAHAVMGTRIVRTYGSTELPTSTMGDPSGDLDAAAEHDGVPMNANEVGLRRGDNGLDELVVRGPELFLGYLDARLNAEAFTDDGYFRTGDAAAIEADGSVRITGRIKDVINRGGEKFSAAEVEAVLLTHPGVADVAVVAYPDAVLGERACAFVVPSAGRPAPDVTELRNVVVAAGMAVQKAPELVIDVDALPRTASGKVQRYVLRDHVRREVATVDGQRAGTGAADG